MIIGFTGSAAKITKEQRELIKKILTSLKPAEAHHGGCIGADNGFHEICLKLKIKLVVHPGTDGYGRMPLRADLIGNFTRLNPIEHLSRNKKIIDCSDIVLAIPDGPETRKSGTWSTVRYAKKSGKKLIIIYSNGVYTNDDKTVL
jgi:hypothetical protein